MSEHSKIDDSGSLWGLNEKRPPAECLAHSGYLASGSSYSREKC